MLAHLQNLLSGMQLSQDVLMILFFIIILMSTNKSPTQRKLTKYVLNEWTNVCMKKIKNDWVDTWVNERRHFSPGDEVSLCK